MSEPFASSGLSREALEFHCPRWRELPALELYMDQLTGYIAGVLAPLMPGEEKERPLTKAMVNNYVKAHMLPRPEKKKYRRDHMAHLILLCAMKQVLSLPEARAVLALTQAENDFPRVYDCFCQELENALAQAWGREPTQPAFPLEGEGRELMLRFVRAYAGKVYLQKRIAFEEEQAAGL